MTRSLRYNTEPDGHGADAHRGRFLLGGAGAAGSGGGVVAAMERLLELGEVRMTSYYTSVGGQRLHHLEAGSGPAVVLLHGACGGAANWYRLVKPLAREHRIIALDLPGFGLSEAGEVQPPLAKNVAELVLRWLSALGVADFGVVGTSFGSLLALRMGQAAPDRVGKIALINAVGLGRDLPLSLRVACMSPVSKFALRPSRFGTRWQFFELMTAHGKRLPASHVEALLEYLWQSAQAADRKKLMTAFTHFAGAGGQREILAEAELRAIRQPVLLIWGELDRFIPLEHGRRAADLVPRALLRIIPAAGHSPNWEAPEAVMECLQPFLGGLRGN